MQKAIGHISAVLKGILFIGISIQTVFGIVWMCCNFSFIPQFGESLFYMQLSRTLRCDEYTGILYPLFLWIVRRNHYVVYVLQLAAAYAASRRFLCTLRPDMGKCRRIWCCLACLTIPVALQCHLAMLPCSFVSSLLLLELSLLSEAVKVMGLQGDLQHIQRIAGESGRTGDRGILRRLTELCGCWLVSALLLPEYLYLGAVPVLCLCFCCRLQWKGQRRRKLYGVLLIAAFIGMIAGISSLTQTEGLYGKVRKTPLMAFTQRIAWTSLLADYEGWPWQIIYHLDEYTIIEAAWYADGMDRLLFPAMEKAVADQVITEKEAIEYCGTLIETAWRWHKSVILREMAWDVLGYGASPAFLQSFLAGEGYDSYSSRNYEVFLEHTPKLSKRYMDYGSWWFTAALGLTAVLQLLQWCKGHERERRQTGQIVLCFLAAAGAMVLWYTMRGAGMMDYKNTLLIDELWMTWTVLLVIRREAFRGE